MGYGPAGLPGSMGDIGVPGLPGQPGTPGKRNTQTNIPIHAITQVTRERKKVCHGISFLPSFFIGRPERGT